MDQYYNESPQPQLKRKNSFATASLVLGIVSIVTGLLFLIPIPFITALLGIIFGFVSKQSGERIEGKAIIGIALSAVTVITLIALVVVAILFLNSPAGMEFVTQFMEEYSNAMKVYQQFYN